MSKSGKTLPIFAIIGETASGKSRLAMQIAQHLDADILCADATTVYRGFDIGSAKPSDSEQQLVRHYGIDIAEPNEVFTAAKYQAYAKEVLAAQAAAGRTTVLVGGSGLYIDSVLYDYSFAESTAEDALADMSTDDLQQRIRELYGEMLLDQIDRHNPRRLIGVLRRGGVEPTRGPLIKGAVLIGLRVDRELLEARIEARVDAMFLAGLEAEVSHLAQTYGWGVPAMQAIGYREFQPYLTGAATLAHVREQIIIHTRQLAKKQRTWFGRNQDITWVTSPEEAVDLVTTNLHN